MGSHLPSKITPPCLPHYSHHQRDKTRFILFPDVSDKKDKNRKYIKSIKKVYFFLGFQTKKYIFWQILESIGKFEYTNFPQIVY